MYYMARDISNFETFINYVTHDTVMCGNCTSTVQQIFPLIFKGFQCFLGPLPASHSHTLLVVGVVYEQRVILRLRATIRLLLVHVALVGCLLLHQHTSRQLNTTSIKVWVWFDFDQGDVLSLNNTSRRRCDRNKVSKPLSYSFKGSAGNFWISFSLPRFVL